MRLAWVVVLLATAVLTGPLQALIDGVTPQQVVDLLNSIRGNVVPTAAQMVRLTWNDTLAAAAARYAATQCAANFDGQGPQCPDCANWIGEGMYPSATTHGMLDSINDLMGEKAQWSCTQSGTTLSCKCSSYHCYDNWKVILNDGATTVGCGELLASTCGGSYNIYVCAFNGFSSYAHPYTLSATNSSCTQGTCPSAYPSCVNSLYEDQAYVCEAVDEEADVCEAVDKEAYVCEAVDEEAYVCDDVKGHAAACQRAILKEANEPSSNRAREKENVYDAAPLAIDNDASALGKL
ncbi:unnamed protein product (mitochondrion) [Plasmodiophora brassicae]|uniref:SCP domain-containing protein n=1 Tax=Plasmodiophora brassicae TaxID=37360 RepID=A0A3P3YGE1_PLABS|nr:unnamed protein product [Plasmodiophora brassicae]